MLAGHRGVGTLLDVDPALDLRSVGASNPPTAVAERTTAAAAAAMASGAGVVTRAGVAAAAGQPTVAVMPLAGPAVLVTALANDAVTLRRRLSATPSTRT